MIAQWGSGPRAEGLRGLRAKDSGFTVRGLGSGLGMGYLLLAFQRLPFASPIVLLPLRLLLLLLLLKLLLLQLLMLLLLLLSC